MFKLQWNYWSFWVAVGLVAISCSTRADFKSDQNARDAAYVEYDTWLSKNRGATNEEKNRHRENTVGAAERKFRNANRAEYDRQTQASMSESVQENNRRKAHPRTPEPASTPRLLGYENGRPIFEKSGPGSKVRSAAKSKGTLSGNTAAGPAPESGGRGRGAQSTGVARPEFSLESGDIPKEIEFGKLKSKSKPSLKH